MSAPRVVGYGRVSRSDQAVGTQIVRLREAAARLGLELTEDRILVDDGVSGRLMERPAFDQVRELVESERVEVVLTMKLDRLGRSARGVLEFFELAESHGVRILVVDQGIDTSTPLGRFVRTIAAGFAELEADLIRERTRDRLSVLSDHHRATGTWATRSGRPIGRPPRVTAEILSRIVRLREVDGLRWAEVARRLHVPATSARKWYSAAKRAARTPASEKPRVINPAAEFVSSSDGESAVSRPETVGLPQPGGPVGSLDSRSAPRAPPGGDGDRGKKDG